MAHLVFQTAFPGDLFLSIPLLKRLKLWEPETSITLACRPGLGEFFLKVGLVDEVIEINKRSRAGRLKARRKLMTQVWDVVLVPHQSVRTALWIRSIRSTREKISFRQWWNFPIFDRRVVMPIEYPDALRQLSLLTPLDDELANQFASVDIQKLISPVEQSSPWDFSTLEIPDWASMQILPHQPKGRRIFLAPGSVWPTKRWTKRGYIVLAQLLQQRGFEVQLVGSPNEEALCLEICQQVPGITSHAGRTSVFELVELLASGAALVTNDSGAMHAAAVVGLPTVAIFGPTVLAQGFRPWQSRSMVVQRTLGCRPCGKHGAKKCPIRTHECMEKITPADVLSAVFGLLNQGRS